MPDQKISEMTVDASLDGSEVVPVVQSGNKRTTTAAIAALAPGTNLGYDPATRLLTSSTGTDQTLPLATTSAAGLQSAADKTKLDSITVDQATIVRRWVRNETGSTIAKGIPVYISVSNGTTPTVVPADASTEETAARTIGLTQEAISHQAYGWVIEVGRLEGINTSTLTEGQIIWLSETTGQMTSTRPTQPAHGVVLGYCVKQGAGTSGIIDVKVDNGLELAELHDVLVTGAVTDDVLAKAADGLWKKRTLGSAAALNVGTTAGTVAAGDDSRLSDAREWTAATVDQAEAEAGTATTRRAWTAQRVRQAIAAWWTGASTAAGRALVTAVDAAAQRTALALSSADSPQFTGVGLGIASRTGYAAALGSGVFSRAQIVTAAGSTYSCDIRTGTRFILSAAIAGNTTIQFTNVADLTTGASFAEYVEVEVDFRYTSGVITVSAAGFTTVWDGNAALIPTAGEIETIVVRITPAVAGTPLSTATLYAAQMRGRT